MRFPARVRAILFDLDGTLVDTAPDIAAAVDATLRELGYPSVGAEQVRSWIGRGVDVLLHRVLTREHASASSSTTPRTTAVSRTFIPACAKASRTRSGSASRCAV